ncbi:MAG: hypothetical protein ACYC06_07935 [Ilumatobacteraceae bacterium]
MPRAHRDPINSATQALSVFSLAIARPLRPETLVLMMSHDHRGVGLFALNSAGNLCSLIDHIVGRCATENTARAIAITSVRSQWQSQNQCGDEWVSSRNICQRAGVQLVDWFVVSHHGVHCPRITVHEPATWHSQN